MDVGVITDEISQDIEESLRVMKRCDVTVSEIRSVWGKNSVDMDSEELAKLKKILKDAGSTVCAIASPFYKCDLFDDGPSVRGRTHEARDVGRDQQLSLLERAFQVAEVLGTDKIRVFAFWRQFDPTPEIEERILEAFEEPVAMAERSGMQLLLENEHACFLGTGAETARVLQRITSQALGAVWDPGNAVCGGETPYPDGYDAIRPWVRHIHVKDAAKSPDGSVHFVKVGDGVIDYKGQIARLRADGYSGILSLETHYSKDNGDRLAASEESLRSLAALVRGN